MRDKGGKVGGWASSLAGRPLPTPNLTNRGSETPIVGLTLLFGYRIQGTGKQSVSDTPGRGGVKMRKMPKTKAGRKSTEGVGRGWGNNPTKSPKVGGSGTRKLPARA